MQSPTLPLLVLTLAACAGKHDTADSRGGDSDSAVDSHDSPTDETGCTDTSHAAAILSPADGAVFVVGDAVPLGAPDAVAAAEGDKTAPAAAEPAAAEAASWLHCGREFQLF